MLGEPPPADGRPLTYLMFLILSRTYSVAVQRLGGGILDILADMKDKADSLSGHWGHFAPRVAPKKG